MDKKEVHNLLIQLNHWLEENLPPKKEVIKRVKDGTSPGGEREGIFVKQFLYTGLKSFTEDYFKSLGSEDWQKQADETLIVEGIKPTTQHRHSFFGSKPAPDFLFKSPFPFTIVGEAKYSNDIGDLQTLVGQTIVYLISGKTEEWHYNYGYGIFYDISESQTIKKASQSRPEQELYRELWNKLGIFIGII